MTPEELIAFEEFLYDTFVRQQKTHELALFINKTEAQRNAQLKAYIAPKIAELNNEKAATDKNRADKLKGLTDLNGKV